MNLRRPTAFEEAVLRKILAADAETSVFLSQLEDLQVETIDDYGSLALHSPVTHANEGMSPIRAEAHAKDADDIKINFIVFASGPALTELQIYKDDGTPIKRMPAIGQIETIVL